MMWRFGIALWCALALVAGASPQTDEAGRAAKADEILTKVRQLDVLNQILPVIMTKQQLRDLLPAIERARRNVRETQRKEFDELRKLDPKLEAAVKDALEKNKVPSVDLIKESAATFRLFEMRRRAVAQENEELVLKAFKEILTDAQEKAAANSLNPKLVDPNAEVSKLDQEQKLRLYVRGILLDPIAYDVLVKLAK
jgi:hypothetical protein